MIKLPEPYSIVGGLLGHRGSFSAKGYELRNGSALYTEAQLRQAVRDAYEDAGKVCENESCSCCWDESATEMAAHLHTAIRALIKEVV